MSAETNFNQDWLKNWQAKIAVRITSIIIWSLSFISMIIAGILISQVRSNVENSQNIIIDHLAYQIQSRVQQNPALLFKQIEPILNDILNNDYILGLDIKYNGQTKTYGTRAQPGETIVRKLNTHLPIIITAYTLPIKEIVRQKQIEIFMLFSAGIIFLGGFIMLVIDKSVQKPFQHLDAVAQQYTAGQHSIRANTDRHDEFGTLAVFLNQMLDRISTNEKELQNEVKERTIAHEKIKQQRDALQQLTMDLTITRDKANEANLAKTIFLANMSHELRTPLNAIIGYSELIKEDTHNLQNPQLIHDTDKIIQAGKHLLRLINQVLDISKIESGKMDLIIETISIQSLIQDICSTLKPAIENNGNKLVLDINSDIDFIQVDPTRTKQILFNLIDNANKFTHGGEIKLTANMQENKLMVCIQDSGIGIEEDKIEHIFDEFVQADISTTRRYGGTGLGLSICRHLVQLMGGDISVRSSPGQGSRFTILIPLIQDKMKDAI